MLYSFPGGSVRGPMLGTEVHPRFPWGKAQDQFSLFLPVFVNAGISHHHPASVPYLDFWGSFLPLLPYFVPLFWVWRQGAGVYVCVCVCTRVHVQCQASQNLQREEVEDNVHTGCL